MTSLLVKVATCNLNQFALDFDGNLARIVASIRAARAVGARFRTGPELETCGYACGDHFLEPDTLLHSWQSIARLLQSDLSDGLVCDIGAPVLHAGVLYNCRVFILDRRIVLIRPKTALANDGNYRETRYFTAYSAQMDAPLQQCALPPAVGAACGGGGQRTAPFGCAILQGRDASVAAESCEELFTPVPPHVALFLNGADIVANGSCSHHQLRKLHVRVELMTHATRVCGGVYMYAVGSASALVTFICALCTHSAHAKISRSMCTFTHNTAEPAGVRRRAPLRLHGVLCTHSADANLTINVHMYTLQNQQGCDGERLYYDGCASVFGR
jgi:NAD+ synthase (glutamine-hydrolysing)